MVSDCIHYWIIEPPAAPESKGICKKCGEVRMFANSIFINRKDSNEAMATYNRRAKETRAWGALTEL